MIILVARMLVDTCVFKHVSQSCMDLVSRVSVVCRCEMCQISFFCHILSDGKGEF